MFEGIKRGLRAVQYGDAATRRRWFFVCTAGLFCAVAAGWLVYEVWRGSFEAGMEASVRGVRAIGENFFNHL